jgi:hypothetical protein
VARLRIVSSLAYKRIEREPLLRTPYPLYRRPAW